MDKGVRPEKTMSETRSYKRMPNANIPETEKTKLVWTYITRREEDNISRKLTNMIVPGERRRGRPRWRRIDNTRDDMNKYKLTDDMTENRQYWKTMVKTGPQICGDGLYR